MPILNVQTDTTGQVDLLPRFIYIDTNDTIAEVTDIGYLNGLVSQGFSISESNMALVSTRTTPNSKVVQLNLYDVSKSGDDWTLQPKTSTYTIRFAAQYTTAGGAAAEPITITGVQAGDLAYVQMVNNGTGNVSIVDAVTTTDTLTVTFSGNPGNDAIINYQILRASA